jgi:uncharacterized protein YvpB
MKSRIFLVGFGILLVVAFFYRVFYVRRTSNAVLEPTFSLMETGNQRQFQSPSTSTLKPSLTPFQPETHTPTLTHTPTSSATPTISPTSTPSTTVTPSQTPTPLDETFIEGIRGRWAAYSLDCEARSAVDWAAYFGVQIEEITFFNQLPVSDDPETGFVGDVQAPWGQTPPDPYGVYAGPVADFLRDYGLNAVPVRGMTWDQLRAEISQGRPVIVWVVGRVGEGTPIAYTSSLGQQTTVARFEHTVIVTGYSKLTVTVLDGYWVYSRSIRDFLTSWEVLGNMAIFWSDSQPVQ